MCQICRFCQIVVIHHFWILHHSYDLYLVLIRYPIPADNYLCLNIMCKNENLNGVLGKYMSISDGSRNYGKACQR